MSSTTNSAINEDVGVSMLTALGFSANMASDALQVCGGNVEAAANYLLTQQQQGGVESSSYLDATSGATTTRTATSGDDDDDVQMIHGPISQYSVENGRSACTCMALKAAQEFLKNSSSHQQQQETETASNPVQRIDASFLQNVVLSGVATYQEMAATLSSDASVEHLSAEEVLQKGLFPGLKNSGEIRQGLLSHNRNDEQGLKQILLQSHASSSSWGCFLITKPPETVLVCLPPPNSTAATTATTPEQQQQQQRYVLIDTHPRPQQFHAENAYARLHGSLNDLVSSLETIFPATDLDPDIPPLMAAMYNSFDVYGLVLSQ